MKRAVFGIAAITLALFVLLVGFFPAARAIAEAPLLDIQETLVTVDIPAGGTYTHTITLSSGSAMDLQVEAAGLGQTPDGSTTALPASQDSGPYTARPFISNIDKTALHLVSGVAQSIKVTFNVPAGTAPGERYAGIYIHQIADPDITIIVAAIIPVIINTPGYTPSRTGSISGLSVPQAYRGQPVNVNTTFTNTGNCRISNARNSVNIKEKSTGTVRWNNETNLADPSLLPGFPRLIKAKYNTGLSPGIYTATSQIKLEDGTMLDTKTIDFQVVDPPAVPAAPVLTGPGSSTAPGPVINTLTPTFQWGTVSGADYYTLTLSRYPYGSGDVVYESGNLAGTSYTLPSGILFEGNKYGWQMKASNVSGSSAGSSIFYFLSAGSAVPPSVTTGSAGGITSSKATLNGNLAALGTANSVSVSFEYGTTTSYGATTTAQSLTASGTFNADISGLTAGTNYHFRAKAVGSDTVYGDDMAFTTLPTGSLAVTTGAAINISSNGATLNGDLDGVGISGSVEVSFEYGTTASYGATTTTQTLAASGTFNADISGLTANTTYHFRAKAVGSDSVYGDDRTFTTLRARTLAVTTGSANSITSTSATLNGYLAGLGNSNSVSVSFEYGTTASYGYSTPAQTLIASGFFYAAISGLSPDTIYHFRAIILGSTNTDGADATFTTLQTSPTSTASVTPTPTSSSTPISSSTASVTPTPTKSISTPPSLNPPSSISALSPTPSSLAQSVSVDINRYLLPRMAKSSLVVFSFNKGATQHADAIDQAETEVDLSGIAGSGLLIIGKYLNEPDGIVAFSASLDQGGTGKPDIKFVNVRVDGYQGEGTARITVYYSEDEISDFNPDTLFLAYYSGNKWHKCRNISNSIESYSISGDVPVSELTGTIIGLGGSLNKASPAVAAQRIEKGPPVSWSVVGIIASTVIILGGVILILERSRRKYPANN